MIEKGKEEKGASSLLSEGDRKKYAGQYVCIASFQDHTVVSAHEYPSVARKKAADKGYFDPVCFCVSWPYETQAPSCGDWPSAKEMEDMDARLRQKTFVAF